MSSKFLLFLSKVVKPAWERISNLYLNFLDDSYIVGGTPSTLSSYVTHSRSGNATMTDSDGLIKWAPHNLHLGLLNQSAFLCALTGTDDDAVCTAVAGTGSARFESGGLSITSGVVHTQKFYVENISAGFIQITQNATSRLVVNINISDGTTNTLQSDDIDALSVTANGSGFDVSISWIPQSTVNFLSIGLIDGISTARRASITYLGTESATFKNLHLYRSDLGGMVDNPDRGDSYVPTTSSAVYLPRRNHYIYNGGQWVNEGLLTESESRQNLYAASNDFSNATYWNLANANIASSTEASPDNGTFSKFLSNIVNTEHIIYSSSSNFTQATGTHTESIFLKYDNWQYVFIGSNGTNGTNWAGIIFDLQNGVVTDEQSNGTFTLDGYSVEDWGNGVWRVSVTITSVTDGHRGIRLRFSNSATPTYSTYGSILFAGSATDSILIALVQSEAASTPSSYIPTAGSTVTRAAETLTIPAANLPWPTAQVIGPELVTNGTFDTDTDWTKGTGWTITGGELVATSATGVASQVISLTGGSVYRITANNTANIQLRIVGGSGQSLGYFSGVNVDKVFVFTAGAGSVFEVVANGTTTGILDNISVQEINPLSVSIQMDGTMTYADQDTLEAVFWRWYISSSNRMSADLRTSGSLTGQPYFYQVANGTFDDADINIDAYSPDVNVPFNIASRHGSTFINGAVDGTALTADTTPTALPDLSATDLDLAYDFMGTIRTFRIWDEDLTDEGIAYVSERSEEPTVSLSFNKSESSFTVSDWLP